MNKLKAAFLVLFTGALVLLSYRPQKALAVYGQSELFAGSEASFATPFRSTFTPVFTGAGVLMRIDLSSGNVSTDWAQPIDTTATVGLAYVALTTATKLTTPLMYQVNPSSMATNQGSYKDYGPYGIRVTNGLAILKNTADSGEAITGTVFWRK